ncbi:uncharacterized protein QC761_0021080 [Podospora bellae-mahoneyi]|uniref:Uncharacterized protein n=1 Tax=Podospora bellae-mahoneyi TaxID=2093777 RepID=A0ABR0G118_9PEZI|nr:hypothetical protein QC761_0021080 [Podospora bellae-mahoneyi]
MSTMDDTWTSPELKVKKRGRYGRRDYERFDHIASSHMRAGRGSIGKVEVDCRFMFTKSRWGVLGESQNPAGILYLDLDFHQPPDCKLESATVSVKLTEEDGEDARIEHRSSCPVKFTDHYGPKHIRGRETLVQTRKLVNRTPNVNVLGYGAGGLGIDKEKTVTGGSRWNFEGHISSTKGSIWYNTLKWELKENTFEYQPSHNNLIHTAFVLEHNATRFYMTVEISGKLSKFSDEFMKMFKFRDGKKEIVTKIEWANGYSCPLRLDRMARELHLQMEYENMARIPMEMPDALPAHYRPVATSPMPPVYHPQQPSVETMPPTGRIEEVSSGNIDGNVRISQPDRPPPLAASDSLDSLRIASGLIPPPVAHEQASPEADQVSDTLGSTTCVNSSEDADEDEQSGSGNSSSTESTAAEETNEVRPQKGSPVDMGNPVSIWLRGIMLVWLAMLARAIGASVVEATSNPKVKMIEGERIERRKGPKGALRSTTPKKATSTGT